MATRNNLKKTIAALRKHALSFPETVVEGITGRLFAEPTAESLRKAIESALSTTFHGDAIRAHALAFSRARFVAKLTQELGSALDERRP